jgi:uridine kinase
MVSKLINVGGSSGVGKTTLTTFLSFLFDDVYHLKGDDLHKWERNDSNWKTITHLNPDANNLELGKQQIFNLLENKTVYRNHYDHDTGKFVNNVQIKPDYNVFINEGLHSLYDSYLCDRADINIYIKTEENLKYQWKLNRDIEKRGYTKEQVLSAIDMRKGDEIKYIHPQEENADVIVTFTEKKDKSVDLEYECKTEYGCEVMANP